MTATATTESSAIDWQTFKDPHEYRRLLSTIRSYLKQCFPKRFTGLADDEHMFHFALHAYRKPLSRARTLKPTEEDHELWRRFNCLRQDVPQHMRHWYELATAQSA